MARRTTRPSHNQANSFQGFGVIPNVGRPPFHADVPMQPEASRKVNRMERVVCDRCSHWHRDALASRVGVKAVCSCCDEKGGQRVG